MSDIRCKGCEKCENEDGVAVELRTDHYGYGTGHWCDDCYESDEYPYKRGAYYDYFEAGEYLE